MKESPPQSGWVSEWVSERVSERVTNPYAKHHLILVISTFQWLILGLDAFPLHCVIFLHRGHKFSGPSVCVHGPSQVPNRRCAQSCTDSLWHTSLELPIWMVEIRLGPSYYTLFIPFSVFSSPTAQYSITGMRAYLQLLNRPQARLFVRMRNYVFVKHGVMFGMCGSSSSSEKWRGESRCMFLVCL